MKRHFTRWPAVEGYADRQSYRAGDVVEMRCSSRAPSVTASVARVGRERVEVWRREGIVVGEHPYPDDAYATGCGWPVAFTIDVDPAWPSGFYEVELACRGRGRRERRHPRRSSSSGRRRPRLPTRILVLATNTYNAYNQWGGKCLYSGAAKVSFDRPLERGYLRRPAAPDEVAVRRPRGRASPTSPTRSTCNSRSTSPSSTTRCGARRAAGTTGNVASSAGPRARASTLDFAVNSDLEFHPGGARRPAVDAERRPRRVLVVGDARPRRRLRRGGRLVGDLLRQHLLLAGALRGRRPHDGLLQGPGADGRSGVRHRRSPVADVDVVAARRSAGPRRRRPGSASPAAAMRASARRRRGAPVGTASIAPITRCSRAPTCATATCWACRRRSSATRSTAAS